jgi:hypothetical protein
VIPDGSVEDGQTRVSNELSLLLPPLVVHQVILETPEAHAIAAENIAGFETIAQQTVDQKLVAIWQQTSGPVPVLGIQVPSGGVGYEAEWDCP